MSQTSHSEPESLESDGDVIWLSRRRARKHVTESHEDYRDREMELQGRWFPRPTALEGFPGFSHTGLSRGKRDAKYAIVAKLMSAFRAECALRGDTEPFSEFINYAKSVRAEMEMEMGEDEDLAVRVEKVRQEFEDAYREMMRASYDGVWDPDEKVSVLEKADEALPALRRLRNRLFRTQSEPEPLTGE